MFVDIVKVRIKAGNGGGGAVNLDLQKKPSGGNGGDGGAVIVEGSSHKYDLFEYKLDKLWKAEDGKGGSSSFKIGHNGKDIVLRVPLTTNIYENNELVTSISEDGQRYTLATGGEGGYGNGFFRDKGYHKVKRRGEGDKGTQRLLTFELELKSDIIFIGFPNAGKSTILNETTNAKAKVAPYAFTTIDPQLGQMDGITLMDLPGLIEGTYTGKGLGTKFLKHTRSARGVAHFVSLEEDNAYERYLKMRKELENIDPKLIKLPELIILSKKDEVKPEAIEQIKKDFSKKPIAISILDEKSIEDLKKEFKKLLK